MDIRLDANGDQVEIGDIVHCYDMSGNDITASLRGVVNERDGRIFVGDNSLAIGCAERVEILTKGK